jgi:polysulfide reductase chain C
VGPEPGELWGGLIVAYLFFAGMGAGTLAVSALCTMLGPRYRAASRLGALIAPWPVALGTGLLIFDLGRPELFYRLFMTIEWTSPMSVGSWLLTIFLILAFANLFLWIPDRYRSRIPLPWRGHIARPHGWKAMTAETASRWRRRLAPVLIPPALAVGIYTGVLLGATPTRPFWNTPLTAELFLFSAMSSGTALLIVALWFLQRRGWRPLHDGVLHLLTRIDIGLIIVEFFLILPFILHQALGTKSQFESIKLILGGEYTWQFWLVVVLFGLMVPLTIEVTEVLKASRKLPRAGGWLDAYGALTAALLVLVGGVALRWVFVYAGQVARLLPG